MNDFQLDTSLHVQVTDGDLAIGVSNEQQMELLLLTQKGAWKEKPTLGVGIENYLLDNDIDGMLREVRGQWESDGVVLHALSYDEQLNKLEFDGNYNN